MSFLQPGFTLTPIWEWKSKFKTNVVICRKTFLCKLYALFLQCQWVSTLTGNFKPIRIPLRKRAQTINGKGPVGGELTSQRLQLIETSQQPQGQTKSCILELHKMLGGSSREKFFFCETDKCVAKFRLGYGEMAFNWQIVKITRLPGDTRSRSCSSFSRSFQNGGKRTLHWFSQILSPKHGKSCEPTLFNFAELCWGLPFFGYFILFMDVGSRLHEIYCNLTKLQSQKIARLKAGFCLSSTVRVE